MKPDLYQYLEHKPECIRNQFTMGEPTADGGYRMKFAGRWYEAKPVDRTPACDCGLDALLAPQFTDTDLEEWEKHVDEQMGGC
jgi:hypothetical protein